MSTIRELRAQLGHVNMLAAEAKEREKAAELAAFREKVELYGISEEEVLRALGFIKAKRRKPEAKYYDPSSGQSWSGRGPRPKWLVGKNLDEYLVRPPAKPWWPGET